MNKSAYRWLVIVSFAFPTLCLIADATIFSNLIPPDLKTAMDRHIVEEAASPTWSTFASLAGAVAVALALPFLLYGQLRFRSWAPKLAIWVSVVSYGLMPFYGPAVYSGITSTAFSLGSMLWGMVVLLPYASPEVRSYFWPGSAQPFSAMKTAGHEVGHG